MTFKFKKVKNDKELLDLYNKYRQHQKNNEKQQTTELVNEAKEDYENMKKKNRENQRLQSKLEKYLQIDVQGLKGDKLKAELKRLYERQPDILDKLIDENDYTRLAKQLRKEEKAKEKGENAKLRRIDESVDKRQFYEAVDTALQEMKLSVEDLQKAYKDMPGLILNVMHQAKKQGEPYIDLIPTSPAKPKATSPVTVITTGVPEKPAATSVAPTEEAPAKPAAAPGPAAAAAASPPGKSLDDVYAENLTRAKRYIDEDAHLREKKRADGLVKKLQFYELNSDSTYDFGDGFNIDLGKRRYFAYAVSGFSLKQMIQTDDADVIGYIINKPLNEINRSIDEIQGLSRVRKTNPLGKKTYEDIKDKWEISKGRSGKGRKRKVPKKHSKKNIKASRNVLNQLLMLIKKGKRSDKIINAAWAILDQLLIRGEITKAQHKQISRSLM